VLNGQIHSSHHPCPCSRLIQTQLLWTEKKTYGVKRACSRLIRTRLLMTVGAGGRTEAVPERTVRSGGATDVPALSRARSTLREY
jgi:hypothetical protein